MGVQDEPPTRPTGMSEPSWLCRPGCHHQHWVIITNEASGDIQQAGTPKAQKSISDTTPQA